MNDFNNIYKRSTDPPLGVHLCHTYNYHAYSSDIASFIQEEENLTSHCCRTKQ